MHAPLTDVIHAALQYCFRPHLEYPVSPSEILCALMDYPPDSWIHVGFLILRTDLGAVLIGTGSTPPVFLTVELSRTPVTFLYRPTDFHSVVFIVSSNQVTLAIREVHLESGTRFGRRLSSTNCQIEVRVSIKLSPDSEVLSKSMLATCQQHTSGCSNYYL